MSGKKGREMRLKELVLISAIFTVVFLSLSFLSAVKINPSPICGCGQLNTCCGSSCLPAANCGDGTVNQASEECDKGILNGQTCTPAYNSQCIYCSATCKNITLTGGFCGNNIKEDGEECDLGTDNGKACTPDYGSSCTYCSATCKIIKLNGPYCGDGQCSNGENCSSCSCDCGVCPPPPEAKCGDGKINQASEECDSGTDNGKACTPDYNSQCTYCSSKCEKITLSDGFCGDGILQTPFEECDDGNNDNGDGCSSCCKIEHGEKCIEDISIRKSYSNSFGTGIAIASENGTWLSALTPILEKGDYKIRYYVDNNVANTTNNASIIVKINGSVLADYYYLISKYHSKTLDLDTTALACNSFYTITVKATSEHNPLCTPDNSSDNSAVRNFYLKCEEKHFCGDGNLDLPEEQCDDGNNDNGDGCSANCTIEHQHFCGDNIKDAGEECDSGTDNGKVCTPAYNSQCTYCSSECKNVTLHDGFCGNGIKEDGEECDKGILNGQTCSPLYNKSCTYCNSQCKNITLTDGHCGDGVKQDGEQCDLGANNGKICTPPYLGSCTYCSAICENKTLSGGFCGDGIKQDGEECDDGNRINNDSCRNNCKLPRCGDGIKDKNEYCDDGNLINGDGCSKTCRFECPNGVCTPNITIEDFIPLVWQCDHRVVYDDATEPGRMSDNGQPLVERINDYAFEGEQIQWKVLVMDKNGIDKLKDVYMTVNGNIEANCQRLTESPKTVDESCNAKILEEKIKDFNPLTMAYYLCTLTVETPDTMYGQSDITVEAEDLFGNLGDMAESESWFLNPTISLDVQGGLNFNSLRPGTSEYSGNVILTNDAEPGSGVLLDMFISGTDFYDGSSSGAKCPNTNQLSLSNVKYYATNGAYSTMQDMEVGRTCDSEGYCGINYGIGFNNPKPFYNRNEILQAQKVGPYYTANLLAPGADMSVLFKVNVPEPCIGNFDTGHVYFWAEAV